MADQKLIDEVGKYIDKYYEPVKDDIKMDKEMLSIFDKITRFRKKRAEEKALQEQQIQESSQIEESAPEEFDVSTMQKTKIKKGIINMMTPIIKVLPLTREEMYVLLEKLAEIHAQLNECERVITEDEMIDFVKLAYMKRETTFITPRTMIRDFIQILDVKRQNPDKGIRDILTAYRFAVDEEQNYEEIDG